MEASNAAGAGELHGERGPLRIERVQCFPVRYPIQGQFRFFQGPGAAGGRPSVIIKITAAGGAVGWGESVPLPRWSYETLEGALAAIQQYIAPVIIGRDAFDLHGLHKAMNQEIANGATTGMPIAKAGVDLALHDLAGKALGVNVARLWGRAPGDEVLLSWTLNPKSLDDVEAYVAEGRERGFAHFNVKVAPDLEYDVAFCRAVKRLVPDGFLWADANGMYDLATAKRALPRLAAEGVPVLEQPIGINHRAGYQELRGMNILPIIVDEGVVSPADLLDLIRLACCDGVAMKPARCGGLGSAVRQLQLLEDAGMLFLGSGLTDPDLSLAASLILYGAFGLKYPAALNGPQFLRESVLAEPFKPVNGRLPVPRGPGLGVEVDEAKVQDLMEQGRRRAFTCIVS